MPKWPFAQALAVPCHDEQTRTPGKQRGGSQADRTSGRGRCPRSDLIPANVKGREAAKAPRHSKGHTARLFPERQWQPLAKHPCSRAYPFPINSSVSCSRFTSRATLENGVTVILRGK